MELRGPGGDGGREARVESAPPLLARTPTLFAKPYSLPPVSLGTTSWASLWMLATQKVKLDMVKFTLLPVGGNVARRLAQSYQHSTVWPSVVWPSVIHSLGFVLSGRRMFFCVGAEVSDWRFRTSIRFRHSEHWKPNTLALKQPASLRR